jgi:transcription-repair coupling factor (superfamily II helicase)
MDLYRRMAAIRTDEEGDDLLDEIIDRYGEPPKSVMNLVDIALLRAKAKELGITDIRQKAEQVHFTMPEPSIEIIQALSMESVFKGRLQFSLSSQTPILMLKLRSGTDSLRQSRQFLEAYLEKR